MGLADRDDSLDDERARWSGRAAVVLAGLAAVSVVVSRMHWWRKAESRLAPRIHRDDPAWRAHIFEFISRNDKNVYAVTAVVILGYLITTRRLQVATFVVACFGLGLIVIEALKALLDGTRPPEFDPLGTVGSWEFPSGHAFAAATVVVVVLEVLDTLYERRPRLIDAAIVAGGVMVGFIRMAAGNHYAGDVLVGYLAGGAWGFACVAVLHRWRARRTTPVRA